MLVWIRILLVSVFLGATAAALAENRCEAIPEVSKALDEMDKQRSERKYSERAAYQRGVLEDLLRKYPGEVAAHRRYVDIFKYEAPDELPAVRTRYQQKAEENPNDAAALYLAGLVLQGHNTPESLRLMEKAKSLDPGFPWPYVSLTNSYSSGKFGDKAKAAENIAGYFRACPDSVYSFALSLVGRYGAPELQAATAERLRERLARETDPKLLEEFSTLWGLEFRTRPVKEHGQVRQQVGADLKRLEDVNREPTARWLDFLKGGYQQSGASKETIAALEDRILREFPSSDQALSILRERWRKQHPAPKPEDSAETWEAHLKKSIEATEKWIAQFPKARYLWQSLLYNLAALPAAPAERAVQVTENMLRAVEEYRGPDADDSIQAAEFYLKTNIQAERALALLQSAESLLKKEWRRQLDHDTLTADDIESIRKMQLHQKQRIQGLLLKAYARLNRVEEARPLKAELDGPVPKDPYQASRHWANLARLAEIEGRKADALAYYQSALHARPKPMDKRYGRVEDPLLDDARKLWNTLGGTEVAWELWSKPKAAKNEELTEGRWERPNKEMPGFELADLSGKTWRLISLEGKTLFINLWATWCGPCQAELPKFQKLYERIKDRSDVSIFTMNVDDELGLVEPFVKEKGYTFPVLPAYSFVNKLLDGISIPRNWIIDAKGKWQWEQIGFNPFEADWEGAMTAKIESVRGGGNLPATPPANPR